MENGNRSQDTVLQRFKNNLQSDVALTPSKVHETNLSHAQELPSEAQLPSDLDLTS